MTGPRLSRAARRRASVAAVATALVLFAAACSSAPTPATTPSATTAAASGLKTIDKAALQSLVDETARLVSSSLSRVKQQLYLPS